MKRFLLNVPNDLHQRLSALARKRGQTLNGLVRQILWDWLTEKDA